MITRSEAARTAQAVLDYKSRSYVEDAKTLARFVLYDEARIKVVAEAVEAAAKAGPDERDAALAAALTAARGLL